MKPEAPENGLWTSEATMEAAYFNASRLARLGRLRDRRLPDYPYWAMAIQDETVTVTRHFGGLEISFELATSTFPDDFRTSVRAIIWNEAQKAAVAEQRQKRKARDRRRARGVRALADLMLEYGIKRAVQMVRARNAEQSEVLP